MESTFTTAIAVFWLFLPAGLANMAPSLFAWLPLLSTPVDFGKTYKGKPIFGAHKTYRGFVVAVLAAILTLYVQKQIHIDNKYLIVDYQTTNLIWLGFLLGFGALLGDLIKSFFKRRRQIPSGYSWIPFDQIDWVVGAILLSSVVIDYSFKEIVLALLIFGLLHPIVNLTGYTLGVKSNKF